jgi:hypothetical protein
MIESLGRSKFKLFGRFWALLGRFVDFGGFVFDRSIDRDYWVLIDHYSRSGDIL